MSPDTKRNTGHSVFQRLLHYAKDRKEDFNFLLFRYGVERLLYRLSISRHADKFILKGASLFLVWKGQNYRVTKDADLLCLGPADADGVIFMGNTVRAGGRSWPGIFGFLGQRSGIAPKRGFTLQSAYTS